MPAARKPIWKYFIPGKKQNGSHDQAHCRGCLDEICPPGAKLKLDENGHPQLDGQSWLVDAFENDVGGVLGVKDSMLAHILGKNKLRASDKEAAWKKRKGKWSREDSDEEGDDEGSTSKTVKRKLLNNIKSSMKQTQLKVFRGIDIPFSEEQIKIIQQQVLHISGCLLDSANDMVMDSLRAKLGGEYAVLTLDGWKDSSRNAISGVNLSVRGKKGWHSYVQSFGNMIDKAEETYSIQIIGFCCDNDGGSQRGRKDLIIEWPWLFGSACCAHQFQLILGDYFDINKQAAAIAEEVMGLIGWVHNHGRVRTIFEEVQAAKSVPPGKVLSLLVGWCQKNHQKKKKLENNANTHCDLLNSGFWHHLKGVVDDLSLYGWNDTEDREAVEALDQPIFVLALVLNPFEGLSCFGDAAMIYERICSPSQSS
ncbi:hypothetical protein CPB84DRAFT_1751072 [Gymnopilus junonius]|uniref:DUF659 domain-containing protein n=1 Tax=Gymnopilus junonius TaxID=109634 RepID=A0A9P5NCE2_GYMJU|nr:hypothetical protein CPB84DRAFT_1751072 [Gymnopilus junonius]